MSKRHDALFDEVLNGLETKSADPQTTPPARAGNRYLRRSNVLAERASGALVEKTLHRIDPARCRMWSHHNRRYDLLDEESCADLIEGIKAQGAQEFPAIVRPLPSGGSHDYEVICGARRHWTISWLRTHNYPQLRFLIEVRELTDEEAFRLADIENRDRRDITDYERAVDYARACELYYAGHQGRMAERLEVSNAWLSRYLDLARLPEEIVAAYGRLGELREFHARRLKQVLASHVARQAVLETARRLAADQAALKTAGSPRISGPKVLAALMEAGQPRVAACAEPLEVVRTGPDGTRVVAKYRGSGDRITLTVDGIGAVDAVRLERLADWLGERLRADE